MQVCTSSGMYAGKIFLNVQSHSHGSKTLDLSMRLKSFRGIHLGTSNVNVAEDRNQISTLKILNMGHRSSLLFLKYGCISKQGRRGCQYYLVGTICPPPLLSWDRFNISAKIWWCHSNPGTPRDDRISGCSSNGCFAQTVSLNHLGPKILSILLSIHSRALKTFYNNKYEKNYDQY